MLELLTQMEFLLLSFLLKFPIILLFIVFLFSVILHEIAHGYVAYLFGDPTAKELGRITLNPLRHIDLIMTIVLPFSLYIIGAPVFGGAKPVPINPYNFLNPRRDMAYVALAGPLTNFALAALCYAIFSIFNIKDTTSQNNILIYSLITFISLYGIIINLVIGVFNLTPIPPLDGGRVAVGFLPVTPAKMLARLEPLGLPIVFALLYTGVLDSILKPIIQLAFIHLGQAVQK